MVQATENADDSSDSSTENFKDVWTTPHENTVEVRDQSLLDNAPNYLLSWVRYPKEIYIFYSLSSNSNFSFGNFFLFQRTNDKPIQLQQLIEKPLQVSTKDPNLKDVGWFQPVTDDPIYSWVWTDMNYDEDAEEFHEGLALS